jgi:hypothetical protein
VLFEHRMLHHDGCGYLLICTQPSQSTPVVPSSTLLLSVVRQQQRLLQEQHHSQGAPCQVCVRVHATHRKLPPGLQADMCANSSNATFSQSMGLVFVGERALTSCEHSHSVMCIVWPSSLAILLNVIVLTGRLQAVGRTCSPLTHTCSRALLQVVYDLVPKARK